MKVQANNSSEPPLGSNQDQMPFTSQGWLWPFSQVWELQKYYVVFEKY